MASTAENGDSKKVENANAEVTASPSSEEEAGGVTNPKQASELCKKLGNDAFVNKQYEKAIQHYNEAIKLDPENAVFYSNRSACYASMHKWQEAYEDAVQCVAKDSTFIKGYVRLAIAQTELGQYDDAETTLRAALAKEPDNDQAKKQLNAIRSKRAAKKAAATGGGGGGGGKRLTEGQIKEYYELQDQLGSLVRDLRGVVYRLAASQRDSRSNQITRQQIEGLSETIPLYRSVGKAFLLTPKQGVEERLDTELETFTKNQRDLVDRKEFLERRIASVKQNITDLTGGGGAA